MASLIETIAWHCWYETGATSFPITEGQYPEKEMDWDPDCLTMAEGKLVFANRNVLLSYVEKYVSNEIIIQNLDNPKTLYEELRKVWTRDRNASDQTLPQALATVNNNGTLELFTFAHQSIPFGHSVFDIIFLIENAIPLMTSINIQSLFAFSGKAFEKLKGDMMGGRIYNQIEGWLRNYPESAFEIIEAYKSNPTENTNALFRIALTSIGQQTPGTAFDLIAKFSQDSNNQLSAPAIATLGHIKYNFPKDEAIYNSALSLINEIIILEDDPRMWAASSALTYLVRIRPKNHALLKLLIRNNHPESLYCLSEFLFLEGSKHSDKQWFKNLFLNSFHVTTAQKGIIDNLDYVLSTYLEKLDTQKLGILFLEKWLQNLPSNTPHIVVEEYFNDSLNTLVQKDLTGLVITKWFVSKSFVLNEAANELIAFFELHKGKDLYYDEDLLALMAIPDIYKMVLRTLGYVYQEHIIHSLIWSLTNKKI